MYIVFGMISTIYCLYWDYYMDWGLFRSKEKGRKYLRNKIMYPAGFYYYAMISNTILRLFWVLSVFSDDKDFPEWVDKS